MEFNMHEKDINETNRDGETALIIAAPKGNLQEIHRLLEVGADPCHRDRHGMTARMRAENRGHANVVAMLQEAERQAECEGYQDHRSSAEIARESQYDGDAHQYTNNQQTSSLYSVYIHPSRGHKAVRHGFAWLAFFFPFIWGLVNRLWIKSIGIIIAFAILSVVSSILSDVVGPIASLIPLAFLLLLCVYSGIMGRQWLRENLQHRGYSFLGTSNERTADAAISEIIKNEDKEQQVEGCDRAHRRELGKNEADNQEEVKESLSEYDVYEQIADELESGETDRALWTKALAMSDGYIDKQKACYVKLRAAFLLEDNTET